MIPDHAQPCQAHDHNLQKRSQVVFSCLHAESLFMLPKLSQCTSLKTQSIFRRFGLMLRPSSGPVIQNSTKNDMW